MEEEPFKVIFIGESGTGAKTSLINNIIGQGLSYQSTTSCSFVTIYRKNYLGNKIRLDLWDTVGQETFRSLTKIFMKDSHCVILGYDITNKKTFEEIEYHYKTIKEILGDFPLIYLVANKIDLFTRKEVSEEEGISFAEKKDIKFFPVSAYTGYRSRELR